MLLLVLVKLFFSIITIIIAGSGLLMLFTPLNNNFRFLEKLAYSYGLGIGVITMIMLILSLLNIPLNSNFLFPIIFILIIFIISVKKINSKKVIQFFLRPVRRSSEIP